MYVRNDTYMVSLEITKIVSYFFCMLLNGTIMRFCALFSSYSMQTKLLLIVQTGFRNQTNKKVPKPTNSELPALLILYC